jgi:transcriptional regulator with XRE-family HTH domain
MAIAKEAADLAGLGRFIRERRHVLGLTQNELATRLGWVQEKISALECGKYGMPALPALATLAEGLQVRLYDVLAAAGYADERGDIDRDSVQVAATEVPSTGRPVSAQMHLQGIRSLAQESNRLASQLVDLQGNLAVAYEQMERVDQLRNTLMATRRRMELLTTTLQDVSR